MKKIFFALVCLLAAFDAQACTNFIVGKKASVDGSVIVSYSADDYGAYGHLFYQPAGRHNKGDMRALYHYESNNYLGAIPQVDSTYAVIGLTNEHQLTIFETTWGGRDELVDTKGLFDYGSLMQVTLQRARTAREALKVMTDLVAKYGYQSSGESFTVADPNEVWILEMVGKGPGGGSPVWVARRVPDDCISGHANQARIRQFPLNDKENCIYSKDVISFAKKKGYYKGKDEDFSFADAYNPAERGQARFCDARVWSYFNKWGVEDMSKCLDYITEKTFECNMPLWVRPKQKLSVQDVKDMMRDHYEGTPLALDDDLGQGPWEMPYRPTPLTWKVDGKTYFNERPISTQQSANVYVAQMRNFLPDYIGGIVWFANDEANMVPFVPIYVSTFGAPACFDEKAGDTFTFSFQSAFWLQNWVSNMVYPRYSVLFPELEKARVELETKYNNAQSALEAKAKGLSEAEAKNLLSEYSKQQSQEMMKRWMQLAETLIVKYNDMATKTTNEDGSYKKTPGGVQVGVQRSGYPERYRRKIVEETGDRFLMEK